ncbi:MAG: hypothetical protein QGH65_14515 [SAR324 cluster bacterium]|nr:hypothetical protein [SAR324 cluster bacterium]
MCSKRLQIFTPYHPPFRHLTQGERKNANLGAKKTSLREGLSTSMQSMERLWFAILAVLPRDDRR